MKQLISTAFVFFIWADSIAQNVGIGTTTPKARLHVADSSVLFTGPYPLPLTAGETPLNGTGSRLMWYADKAAFRTGAVTAAEWNKDNIGNYSFASGFSVKAKGAYATAMGYNNNAMGDYSFSIGGSNQANADYSTAAGSFNHANGYNSFVAGMYNDSILGKQNAVTATTPLFIIGNGDNNDARSNAMVVQKNGNVGIGTSYPNASAALEINSNSKGLLLPRVTDTSAVPNPAKGLIIYATAKNKMYYYDGSRWQQTMAGGGGMDSLWYKKDTVAYSTQKYIGINTDYKIFPPQANLQVAGSLLIQQPLIQSNSAPASVHTMVNGEDYSFPSLDSSGRFFDPGGSGVNYSFNTTASVKITQVLVNVVGVKLSFDNRDWGLASGDTIWVSNYYLPECRNNYQYRFTNSQLTAPNDVFGIFKFGAISIVFKSDLLNSNNGFDITYKKLYGKATGLAKATNPAGNILYFNPEKGSLIAGRLNNNVDSIGLYAVSMGGSTASGDYSIAGGYASASGDYSIAMGGSTASGDFSIAGGYASASGAYSVATGFYSTASGFGAVALGRTDTASGDYSTASGYYCKASGEGSTAMGFGSTASGIHSFAAGGGSAASGEGSTAMGFGTASGNKSTAIGYQAEASGNNSVAIGTYVSTNGLTGSFVFGDHAPSAAQTRSPTAADQFACFFDGGYYFVTDRRVQHIGVRCLNSQNSWSAISDVRLKEKFEPINGEDFLHKISAMPLTTWNYKGQDSKTLRHYGPMAQDFYAAFGKDKLGTIGCDTLINQQDFLGVNLIAIQALEKRTAKISQLEKDNQDIKKENEMLKNMLLQMRKELDELKVNGKKQ
ncbi:MAG: tail fiber domain-containing protein [Chitinophagaceae bacterium]|nr:tail fiber domain-containing protein [Chitinophagaceae bacterium]